jgi:hypothetical protein
MREREGGKQSSHQHKGTSMQSTPSLKTHTQRERIDDIDKYNCCCNARGEMYE